MKVLFIIPRMKSLFGDELSKKAMGGHPHVGIAYLVSVLKQENIDISIFDETIEGDYRELHKLVTSYNPTLIGITAFSYCLKYALDIISKIKVDFEYPVVIGGPHVSATGSQVLSDTAVDFAVKGEGEATLIELIKALQDAEPNFSKIDGLIWRQGDKIIENRDRAWRQALDSLPFPDYEAFKLKRYSYTSNRTLPIITSRGCPYNCNFCSVRLSMGRRFRARSAQNVVDEIESWYRKGWNSFEFNDDCFSFDIDRAEKICDFIIERGLEITYQLYNGIRPDRVNRELLRKMKRSGCIFISYGCEAGNDTTLKTIKKGFTLEHIHNAVSWTREVGINNSVNFIVGHPGETYDTAMDSIKFAKALPTNFVNFYNLLPYPGTELFEWIKQNARNLVPMETYLEDISYRDNSPVFETDEFTQEERQKVLKKGFALYDRTILRFRLGSFLGYSAYLITRVKILAKIARTFALYNKVGKKLYRLLSYRSRKQICFPNED